MARSAFWTIIVDDQPTAFRAAVREDLLPTLKQLQRQHPSAAIKWFQRGKLWETPGDAMDAGKPPRRGAGWRPGGAHQDPREQYKVPRDLKRKRWAAQAAEGRGPWTKGKDRAERRPPNDERRRDTSSGPSSQDNAAAAKRPPRKPFVPRERDGSSERPRSAERDDRNRATGDRPAWKPARDRPDGDRPRSDRPKGAPGARPESDRARKPFQARAERGGKPGDSRPAARRPPGTRPFGDKPGWRPKPEGKGSGPRPDWRGDRRDRRDATARSAGTAPPAAKTGRTWKVGELPPAERKRKKDED